MSNARKADRPTGTLVRFPDVGGAFWSERNEIQRVRIQTSFDVLLREGMVRWQPMTQLPVGRYEQVDLRKDASFEYAALLKANDGLPASEFFVTRTRCGQSEPEAVAGPFTTFPFPTAPANAGTPPSAELSVLDLRPRIDARKKPRFPIGVPIELPPGVPALPLELSGAGRGRIENAALLGVRRGFDRPQIGARLSA